MLPAQPITSNCPSFFSHRTAGTGVSKISYQPQIFSQNFSTSNCPKFVYPEMAYYPFNIINGFNFTPFNFRTFSGKSDEIRRSTRILAILINLQPVSYLHFPELSLQGEFPFPVAAQLYVTYFHTIHFLTNIYMYMQTYAGAFQTATSG